jgi:cell division septation protein DedD
LGLALAALLALGACGDDFESPFGTRDATLDGPAPIGATRLVERDVEAPDVFQVSEDGLWDGRPSLGGVWVAHPDATDPERVIIRNEENGRFVIGALFRRERENPGPELMVSSDAAAALNVLAGDPTMLNVTALRREEVAEPGPAPATTAPLAASVSPDITATPLDDPIAAAAAAIEASETSEATQTAARAPAPDPTPPAAASGLDRAYVQIGIFSVEQNATNTGQALRGAGLVPTIYDQSSNDRRFWRVVVGPANSVSDRAAILETVRGLGFGDAYFVTR